MYDLTALVLIGTIIIIASVIHGLVGFGFAMIMVPVCSLLLPDLKQIVPVVVILSLFIDVIILYDSRKTIDIKRIRILSIFGVAGIPAGVIMLLFVDANVLKALVGVIVLGFALILLKGYRLPLGNERITFPIAGAVSGVLNSSLSLGRLPIALLLSDHQWEKDVYRANATLYYTVLDIVTILMFLSKDLIKPDMLGLAFKTAPLLVIGLVFGIMLSRKTCETVFRRVVLSVLITLGTFITSVSIYNMVA